MDSYSLSKCIFSLGNIKFDKEYESISLVKNPYYYTPYKESLVKENLIGREDHVTIVFSLQQNFMFHPFGGVGRFPYI
jgi:hypothetical protein